MRDCRCARLGTETEELAAGREHPVQLGEGARLFLERQVLEHVQAERAIEAAVRVGKRHVSDPARTRSDE